MPQPRIPLLSHPYSNGYVYGLFYGPLALLCSGPLMADIFAMALTTHQITSLVSMFLWFGLGLGLPLFLLSYLSEKSQRWLTRQVVIHAQLVNVAGGLLLIGIAIYNFWINWQVIDLYVL